MGTQSQTSATASRQHLSCLRLHPKRKKESVIQGKLRMRSIPGAFLVLGVVVLIVGTALAVAGYLSGPSQTSGWNLGPKGFFSTASLIHSERMKLLGPVIMGVGLFILICANTMLYENRDRETQMRSVICSVSTAVPSADVIQVNSLAKHYQWVGSLPAAHLNIMCLQELASEPLMQVKDLEEDGGSQQRAVLCTEVLHHQESSSTSSICSSRSCNSSRLDVSTVPNEEQGVSCGWKPYPEIHCKLSSCLTAISMSMLEGEEWMLSIIPPRRSHSMSYRTKPHMLAIVHFEEKTEHTVDCSRQLRLQSGSEVCMTEFGTVTPQRMEKKRHCSWPQLNLGYVRKYLKLENKEDSLEKLLDQLEKLDHQGFGSGPFQ
ncbi:transmembrane protein 200A [Hoplias malabaricus]|uniref:transmembrane protein 200A n=1 Tax=Hoplias malabaricus TaxID=27720 RepID=UPI0034622E1F